MTDRPVKIEQLKVLFSHKSAITVGGMLVALLTAAVLWSGADHIVLALWFVAMCVVALIRWWVCDNYLQLPTRQQDHQMERWSRIFTILSIINGVVWGSLALLHWPAGNYYIALLLGLHSCYVAAAASSTSIHLPTFYGFVIPSTFLYAIGFLYHGGLEFIPHAVLLFLFLMVCSVLGSRNNKSLTEQILLRFKNIELMAELVDERDKAQNAMLGKNRFLAAASHDLRQPVHALGLFLDSLEGQPQTEASKRILGKIRQSTAALSALFHGLLDISKLDANVVENVPHDYSVDALLSILKTDFQGSAQKKGLQLNIPEDTGAIVYVDSGLLERILRNLLNNAINYTQEGSVSLSVDRTSDDDPSEGIKISISDTGKGIPDGELENIFSEYHQLENPERDRQKGLGLGLAIVRRLCELMGVSITVESEENVGSTFSIIVDEGSATAETTKQILKPTVDLYSKRVIVVDDEKDILDGMESVLGSWGCVIATAETLSNVRQLLQEFGEPDVIIADFRLRDNESGLDVIEAIRDEFNTDIPAILITGDTAPERLQQATKASIELLHKPVEPTRLRSAIVQLVA